MSDEKKVLLLKIGLMVILAILFLVIPPATCKPKAPIGPQPILKE